MANTKGLTTNLSENHSKSLPLMDSKQSCVPTLVFNMHNVGTTLECIQRIAQVLHHYQVRLQEFSGGYRIYIMLHAIKFTLDEAKNIVNLIEADPVFAELEIVWVFGVNNAAFFAKSRQEKINYLLRSELFNQGRLKFAFESD